MELIMVNEGSFERPGSNEQVDTIKPSEVYLWRPKHRRFIFIKLKV